MIQSTRMTHSGLAVTSVRDRTASAAGIEDNLSDSYAARKIALGICADLAKDIVAGLTGNSEWRLDVLDNFGKPVFRVRLLVESLEEAAGFKTVSAVTPASG
jgi:hypothetical protein